MLNLALTVLAMLAFQSGPAAPSPQEKPWLTDGRVARERALQQKKVFVAIFDADRNCA